MKLLCVISICVIGTVFCIEHDFKGFDDTILFGINWPGQRGNTLEHTLDGQLKTSQVEKIKIKTTQKENYECHIPEVLIDEATSIEQYEGPSPIHLLKPIFAQKICSYRLESYWSYEVCHGRYIRQYHDERDGKQVKTQEFFLGHWSPEKQLKLEEEFKVQKENDRRPKTTKVEGMTLSYVEMAMTEGTTCDLNGKPRMTRVLYVCYAHGKHEVYSFKETATCEYEIIILSSLLCEHPQFKPKDVSENFVHCYALGDSPRKPKNLLQMEVEGLKTKYNRITYVNNENEPKDVLAVLKVEKVDKDGETHLKFEIHPIIEDDQEDIEETSPTTTLVEKTADTPKILDDAPVRAFLNGETCLNGGTGWWKYEFCYGKHVVQYHVDRTGEKTTLVLGRFDKYEHLQWIKENKNKAPKPVDQRASVSHFYSGGDICDKTGKPRQTEVKLKCFENSSSLAQVSLYLLEPKTCHYILGVESPLICDILPHADANGLINTDATPKRPEYLSTEKVDSEQAEKIDKELPKLEDRIRL